MRGRPPRSRLLRRLSLCSVCTGDFPPTAGLWVATNDLVFKSLPPWGTSDWPHTHASKRVFVCGTFYNALTREGVGLTRRHEQCQGKRAISRILLSSPWRHPSDEYTHFLCVNVKTCWTFLCASIYHPKACVVIMCEALKCMRGIRKQFANHLSIYSHQA